MTSVASTSEVLGLEYVIDEWTGLPMIKERKRQHPCQWLRVKETILDVGATMGTSCIQ